MIYPCNFKPTCWQVVSKRFHIEHFVCNGLIVHLSKSKAVQHLNNIFITGWYLTDPEQPAEQPAGPAIPLPPVPGSEEPDPTHEDGEDR